MSSRNTTQFFLKKLLSGMSIQSRSCQTLVGIWYDSYLVLKDGSNVKLYWWWNLDRDLYHNKKVALQVVGNIVQEVVELPDDFIF